MKIVRQGDLEPEGDLAFLLVHPLINQTAKKHLIRCVVLIDGNPDASCDIDCVAVDTQRFAQTWKRAPRWPRKEY